MQIRDIPLPEVYRSSEDFRFFVEWFATALSKVQYDTIALSDIYDSLRCPEHLLWMLADTVGYRIDDRLPTAFNRLVILYFMSMIRYKGSKDGVTLAAEVNLAQFRIKELVEGYKDEHGVEHLPNEILRNRLEDTSIPVNSAYVTSYTADGYIDVVYFAVNKPVDACIEYVRPLGMYCFQYAGVRYDAKTKISVDARLTDDKNIGMSIGPTHVGHYSREDYARIQKGVYHDRLHEDNLKSSTNYLDTVPTTDDESIKSRRQIRIDAATQLAYVQADKVSEGQIVPLHSRRDAYIRNSKYEGDPSINAGYRALYSLQLCNNEHVVRSLLRPIFDIGYQPEDVSIHTPNNDRQPKWNLLYNSNNEPTKHTGQIVPNHDVITVDKARHEAADAGSRAVPAVNPVMGTIGDAIAISNKTFTKADVDSDGNVDIKYQNITEPDKLTPSDTPLDT